MAAIALKGFTGKPGKAVETSPQKLDSVLAMPSSRGGS
jgi:hypothetical protein